VKIAQVCMPFLSVPPMGYGGLERVVSYLTEALVLAGHEVTLFASGDSKSRARIIAPCDQATGIGNGGKALYLVTLGMVARLADEFDIIHFHFTDWAMLPYVRALRAPSLITYHMPIDTSASTKRLFREYAELPLVSVSNAQRPPECDLNWQKTIYNGLPPDLYAVQEKADGYCAFLGRLGPSKGPHLAIDVALAANVRLKLAGPIQQQYFDGSIAPRLRPGEVEYVGELDDVAKQPFLGGADALLFFTQVQEAFGLVMIEAMACGTPVIALDRGSSREIITDGRNGFVVSSVQEGASRVSAASRLSRAQCRAEFDSRFSDSRMCHEYCEVYERIVADALK
jgi:glycosyltransferase involved in cell wall biosynthesis